MHILRCSVVVDEVEDALHGIELGLRHALGAALGRGNRSRALAHRSVGHGAEFREQWLGAIASGGFFFDTDNAFR